MCLCMTEQDFLYAPAGFLEHVKRCRVQPFGVNAKHERFLVTMRRRGLRLAGVHGEY